MNLGHDPRAPERNRGPEGADGEPPPLVPGADERQGGARPRNQHLPQPPRRRRAKVGPQGSLPVARGLTLTAHTPFFKLSENCTKEPLPSRSNFTVSVSS